MAVQLASLPGIPGAICSSCSLACDGIGKRAVHGKGTDEAELVIVGEAPGNHEVQDGIPFTGPSGKLLWRELAKHDISRGETYVTNVLLCPAPQGKPLKAKDVAACDGRLERELRSVRKRTVILALGATAAVALRGGKAKIGELNGRVEWNARYQAHVVYAYHPAAILRNPDLHQELTFAVQQAVWALELPPGPQPVEPIRYDVETSLKNLTLFLEALREGNFPKLVVDIETTGLDPWRDRILSVGIGFTRSDAYIIPDSLCYTDAGMAALRRFVSARGETKHVYHNGKFDVQFLRTQLGVPAIVDADSMLLHYCIDERSGEVGGFHDLKRLSHKFCGAPHYDDGIDGSKMAEVPRDQMYEYQANDLVYTFRLYEALERYAAAEPKSRNGWPMPQQVHDKLLVPASEALSRVEARGLRVDRERLQTLNKDYIGKYLAERQRCEELATAAGVDLPNFNPASFIQVRKTLLGMGYPLVLSTDEEAMHGLQRWDTEHNRPPNPFINAVLEARSLKHTRSTYILGTMKRLERGPEDNDRLRSSFGLHRTTTGRLNSSDPNLQNIPKDSVIKELFIPSDGHTLVEADYRRLEVGVLAWYSGDPKLTADFMAEDFHWNVACKIFPDTTKAMLAATTVRELEEICRSNVSLHDFAARQARPSERTESFDMLFDWMKTRLRRQAKYVSFGIMYGEGALALSGAEKGLGVPVSTAAQYITNWKGTYHVAMRFMNQLVTFAKKERWVESASGRRRRFSYPASLETHIANEAMNQPIQALASDICLTALTRLDTSLPDAGLGNVLLSIHDSILSELVTTRLDEGLGMIHETMTTVLVDEAIKFEIDIKVGPNWGQLHDWKVA